MKIAIICPAFLPATQFGGILFLALDIAKEISKKCSKVTVYTTDLDFLNNSKIFNKKLPKIESLDNFQIKRSHVNFNIELFFVNIGMYKQITKDSPEIIHTIGIRSCYDEGKRIAETLCFDYQRMHNTEIRVMRIFNTYGPRMLPNDGRVISNFIVQALKGEAITIYGDGSQTRSFCYVDDLIEGMIKLDTLVVQDIFMTETAWYADIILPASAHAEKNGTFTNTNRQYFFPKIKI